MYDPTISSLTDSATSSPGLVDGRDHCGSLAGPMIAPSGLAAAPVSLSASQAKASGLLTSGTYGPPGCISSTSAALELSLGSRLQKRLTGSVSCEVTWKAWGTHSQPGLLRPRALVRTTFGIVFGLWPTATTPSGGQTVPAGTSLSGKRPDGTKAQVTLQNIVLAVYPTLTVNDSKNNASPSQFKRHTQALNVMAVALWSTIRASDGAKGGPNMSFGAGGSPLPSQVSTVANTSNAPMENGGGSLHPEFAGWVMGYPPAWLSCAPSETPSIRARPQPSSKPRAKRSTTTTSFDDGADLL
jgi:hypothetical protein